MREPSHQGGDNMNGAVYISFFQGQLETVLEQVVQLAVQEISKTVGASLNTLLLETSGKEQENRRLRLQLQTRESHGRGSPGVGRSKATGDENAEQRQQQHLHAPGRQAPTDTRRLEQRGRVVEQLKSVMEQVLDFAVRELTKIVEASFDDLLLELTKMDAEQQLLEERLGRSSDRGSRGAGSRRTGSESESMCLRGAEDTQEELVEASKELEETPGPGCPPIPSVSQDWVPILDKVFGQQWGSEVRELQEGGRGGRSLVEGGAQLGQALSSLPLEPSPSSPQQDPRWTPLEDMEVFSPDESVASSPRNAAGGGSSGAGRRRSSASMLHRLLTLPSQLLEEDADANEPLVALATDNCQDKVNVTGWTGLLPLATREEEEDEEEDEEEGEDKGRKKRRRRVWSECEECGRRFSRMSLLKAHRQSHVADNAAGDAPSPSEGGATLALRCSECGKRFSSATRLHSHIRTEH